MSAGGHHGFLLDDALNLRSGWRFAVYVAVLVAALYATGALISVFVDPGSALGPLVFLALNALALGVPAWLALVFMKRFVDKLPLLAFGVGFHERWLADLALGFGLGAAMVGTLLSASALAGGVDVSAPARNGGFAVELAVLVGILAVAAANEELVFRGYPLQVLMFGLGPWPAFLILSGLFGLGHHLNPNATWVGTTNTALAGILLCLAYARTRSLWLPYGIHIGWNLGIGPIFGFPLSGMTVGSLWVTRLDGPPWLTGGRYGPEGGVLVTGIMILAAVVIGTTRRIGVSPSVNRALGSHPAQVAEVEPPISPLGTGGT